VLLDKNIHQSSFIILLLAILFSSYGFNTKQPKCEPLQIELALDKPSSFKQIISYKAALFNNLNKVFLEKYLIFDFKCLIASCNFNILIKLNSLHVSDLQLVNFNSILEQNLIAQQHSSNLPDNFIK
jgi:hypothetical protein